MRHMRRSMVVQSAEQLVKVPGSFTGLVQQLKPRAGPWAAGLATRSMNAWNMMGGATWTHNLEQDGSLCCLSLKTMLAGRTM